MGEHLENKKYKSMGNVIYIAGVLNYNDTIWIYFISKFKAKSRITI